MTEPAATDPPARPPQLRLVAPSNEIEVITPDEPPYLPPQALQAILTILRRAHLRATNN